jgi:hypothetical protein
MKHTLLITDWLISFIFCYFPLLVVCGRPLAKGEECIVQYVISIDPVLIIIFEKIIR